MPALAQMLRECVADCFAFGAALFQHDLRHCAVRIDDPERIVRGEKRRDLFSHALNRDVAFEAGAHAGDFDGAPGNCSRRACRGFEAQPFGTGIHCVTANYRVRFHDLLRYGFVRSRPVISLGCGTPNSPNMVGAISCKAPWPRRGRRSSSTTMNGTGLMVWYVCGPFVTGSIIISALP